MAGCRAKRRTEIAETNSKIKKPQRKSAAFRMGCFQLLLYVVVLVAINGAALVVLLAV